MTTEYRDGTVADLKPGDGFCWSYKKAPDWEYTGHGRCKDADIERRSCPVGGQPDSGVRIWPGYFKDKAEQPEFDVEALRAKVEQLLEQARERPYVVTEYLEAVLDLLPPKPQLSLEEDLRKWTQTYIAPSLKYEPRKNEEDTIIQGILAIVERHRPNESEA